MHSFQDIDSNIWELRLTLGVTELLSSKEIQDDLLEDGVIKKSFDFDKPDEEFLTALLTNSKLQLFIIIILTEKQRIQRNVSLEEWKDLVDGDSLRKGREALRNEILDFFHEWKTFLREVTENLSSAEKKIQKALEEKVMTEGMDLVTKETDQIVEQINSSSMKQLEQLLKTTGESTPSKNY